MLKVLVVFLVLASQQVLAKGSDLCDDGADCTIVNDSFGKKNGVEICKSGKIIRRKVTYKNDLKEGLWECFDKNGELTESRMYKNDKINGLKKKWQSNIKKFEESEYKDDELNGISTVYETSHSGGQTKISGTYKTHYKDGAMHGLQTIYDADGVETKKFCYRKGQRVELDQDPCFQKNKNEKIDIEKNATSKPVKTKNNSKEKIEYFKSGAVKEKYELAGLGDYEKYEMFFENGQLKKSFKRQSKSKDSYNADIYEYLSYTSKGLVIEKGTCAISPTQDFPKEYCPKFTGIESQYDEKDNVFVTRTYKEGKLHGPAISYFRESHKSETTIYENGIKKKNEIRDTQTNKIVESKEYFEDGSEKK